MVDLWAMRSLWLIGGNALHLLCKRLSVLMRGSNPVTWETVFPYAHKCDQDDHKAQQVSKMKLDWEMRAREDASHFIYTRLQPWTLSEFFEHGKQQAHTLTRHSFKELAFHPMGKRMLEIGCGIGRLFPGFVEMFAEVWGVDVSEEMINQGAKLEISPKVRFIQNNGYDLAAIPDNHFDFVFSYITFQHLPEKWMVFSYLAETYRVLRPGGAFQLHFRTKKIDLRDYALWHLPRRLRRPALVLCRLLLLYPVRHLPLQSGRIPGGHASWVGTGFSPTEIKGELVRLGFVKLKTLADDSHPEGTSFWTIGRKPRR